MKPAELAALGEPLKQRLYRLLSASNGGKSAKADGSYAVGSTIGSVRSENQDAALILRARFGRNTHRDFDMGVVCDGLGGMQRGREAAIVGLVQFVITVLNAADAPLEHRCRMAASSANDAIFKRLQGSGGTTLSAVLLQRNHEPVFAHAGDSRAYLVSGKADVEQVSRDDTFRAALNKPEDDADPHGSRLIQFVGMGEGFEPHVFRGSSPADTVLLTSDGVHGVAASTLNRAVRASNGASDLIKRLLQLSEVLGGLDNASAVCLPTKLSHGGAQPASCLSFLAPADAFEIWLADQLEMRGWVGGDRVVAPRVVTEAPQPKGKPEATKRKTSKSKKKSPQKDSPPAEQLELKPQPPQVSVEFPNSRAQGEPS